MSSLLGELGNNDFLDSIYFKNKVKFGNLQIRTILENSGMGNPVTMVSMLYMLMVILKKLIYSEKDKINDIIYVMSYDSESSFVDDSDDINYVKHIIASISMSEGDIIGSYSFTEIRGNRCVVFNTRTKDGKESCRIALEVAKVGRLL